MSNTSQAQKPKGVARRIRIPRRGVDAPGASSKKRIYGAPLFKIVGLAPNDRIELLRKGFPADTVVIVADRMGWTKEHTYDILRLSKATVTRKLAEKRPLNPTESERILAVMEMVEQVRVMVERSGDATGFEPSRWLARWLESSVPALGGRTPASYLDTNEGVQIVRRLLAQMETGAYA